jgi:uncharacterized YigZ family protein
MKYVKKEFTSTVEEKKSKFITHLCPYYDFDTMMERLKKEHTKARHFVYAYRYLNEFGQIVENSSDDGEPKGTSGKPSLKVLAGNEVINSGVIIVRYFGGIRLGTGGLVRAYSDTVNKVCQEADFILYEKLETKKIELSYNELSKIEYQLQELDIKITNKEFKENVILTIQATKEKLERADVKL